MFTSFIEILKYTVPALVVFATAYFMIQSFLGAEAEKRNFELRLNSNKISLPVRLQAYERITLFLERISPNNIIPRLQKPGMKARDFQIVLLNSIRSEFEHNLSQQLYISPEIWRYIENVKEEIVKVININAGRMNENSTALDLSKAVFQYFIDSEQAMPTKRVLDLLKAEVKKIY